MQTRLGSIVSAPKRVGAVLVDRAVGLLTRPIKLYSPTEVTNIAKLKNRARPGDVLLVSGDARISQVVKILTLSQWSHVVLYVGDRRELLSEKEREEWSATYGYSSLKHLVVDADPMRGVHLKPLDDSVGLMVRHCRPEALHSDDVEKVLLRAFSQLGRAYDIPHILKLLVFFAFPWEFLPENLRRLVRDFTLSEDDRICSRVLAEAFHSVGYPIRPIEVIENRLQPHEKAIRVLSGLRNRGRTARKLIAGGRVRSAVSRLSDPRYLEFHMKGTRHITPADYDLSRFFSVIKDSGDLSVNYRSEQIRTPRVDKNP